MNLEANAGLTFNGDCEAAFKLYAQLLDAKLELVLTWGASPLADKAPREWAEKVLFARLKGRTMTLTGADVLPGTYRAPAGFNLCLSTGDAAEAERLFAELATGGTVNACSKLLDNLGANIVGCAFLINLIFLGGEGRLAPHPVFSLVNYDA